MPYCTVECAVCLCCAVCCVLCGTGSATNIQGGIGTSVIALLVSRVCGCECRGFEDRNRRGFCNHRVKDCKCRGFAVVIVEGFVIVGVEGFLIDGNADQSPIVMCPRLSIVGLHDVVGLCVQMW